MEDNSWYIHCKKPIISMFDSFYITLQCIDLGTTKKMPHPEPLTALDLCIPVCMQILFQLQKITQNNTKWHVCICLSLIFSVKFWLFWKGVGHFFFSEKMAIFGHSKINIAWKGMCRIFTVTEFFNAFLVDFVTMI